MQDNLRQYDEDDYEPPDRSPRWFHYAAAYICALFLAVVARAFVNIAFGTLWSHGWYGYLALGAGYGLTAGLAWGLLYASAKRLKLKYVVGVAVVSYLLIDIPLLVSFAIRLGPLSPDSGLVLPIALILIPNIILYWGFFLRLAMEARQELDNEEASSGDAA